VIGDEKSEAEHPSEEENPDQALQPGEVRLTPAGKRTARYEDLPTAPADKKIHPRRRLPAVPDNTDELPTDDDEEPPQKKK
jgi:hypothetical protein